jgi:hypothetical protein
MPRFYSVSKLISLFACLIVFAFAALPALAAAKASAPVTIVPSNGGQIMTVHSDRYGDVVYISGLVDRPSFAASGAHIHVWGLGKNNTCVFYRSTSVVFTGDPSLIHTEPYQVSVSSAAAAKAQTIYVTFHNVAHADAHRSE